MECCRCGELIDPGRVGYARLELSTQENIYTKVIQELVRITAIG